MNRLLFLLITLTAACVPIYPPPDDGDGGTPLPPPEEPAPMPNDLTFNARLLELRKTHDVYPWFEPYKMIQSDAAPAVKERLKKTHKKPYAVLARELVGVGSHFVPATPASSTRANFDFFLEWGQGSQVVEGATTPIFDDMAIGRADQDWYPYRNGLMLPADFPVTLVADQYGGGTALVEPSTYFLFRGYRLWPKGTISPVQHTYPELAAKGYSLDPFKYQIELDPLAYPGVEQTDTLTFDDEFAIDGISLYFAYDDLFTASGATNPSRTWGWISQNVLLRIDTQGMPLFSDWVSAPLVGTTWRRTSTTFTVPITVPKDTVWTIRMKTDYANAALGGGGALVKMVLHGNKLVQPSAAPSRGTSRHTAKR